MLSLRSIQESVQHPKRHMEHRRRCLWWNPVVLLCKYVKDSKSRTLELGNFEGILSAPQALVFELNGRCLSFLYLSYEYTVRLLKYFTRCCEMHFVLASALCFSKEGFNIQNPHRPRCEFGNSKGTTLLLAQATIACMV